MNRGRPSLIRWKPTGPTKLDVLHSKLHKFFSVVGVFQLVVPSFPIKGFESLENKRFLKTKQSYELQVCCWCNAVKPPPEKVSVFPSNLACCFLPCGSNWCLTERNERRPNLEIGKTSLPSQQLLQTSLSSCVSCFNPARSQSKQVKTLLLVGHGVVSTCFIVSTNDPRKPVAL